MLILRFANVCMLTAFQDTFLAVKLGEYRILILLAPRGKTLHKNLETLSTKCVNQHCQHASRLYIYTYIQVRVSIYKQVARICNLLKQKVEDVHGDIDVLQGLQRLREGMQSHRQLLQDVCDVTRGFGPLPQPVDILQDLCGLAQQFLQWGLCQGCSLRT